MRRPAAVSTAAPTQTTVRGAYEAASAPLANAATATPRYPAASFRPSARPRRGGPARSIFITTVIDQANPWLTPRRMFAATIHHQEGASAISSGTGNAAIQPATSSRFRLNRSASAPAARFVTALAAPKATTKASTAVGEGRPQ